MFLLVTMLIGLAIARECKGSKKTSCQHWDSSCCAARFPGECAPYPVWAESMKSCLVVV